MEAAENIKFSLVRVARRGAVLRELDEKRGVLVPVPPSTVQTENAELEVIHHASDTRPWLPIVGSKPQQFVAREDVEFIETKTATVPNNATSYAAPLFDIANSYRLKGIGHTEPQSAANIYIRAHRYALVHIPDTGAWGWLPLTALHHWKSALQRAPRKNWFVATQHPSALLPLVQDVHAMDANLPTTIKQLQDKPPVVTAEDQAQEAADFMAPGGAYMADFEGKTIPPETLDTLMNQLMPCGYRFGWEADRPEGRPEARDREVYVRVPTYNREAVERREEVIRAVARVNIEHFEANGSANVIVRLIEPQTDTIDSLIDIHAIYDRQVDLLASQYSYEWLQDPVRIAALKHVQAVPLVESALTILNSAKLLQSYLDYYASRPRLVGAERYSMPPSLLVFVAGSDVNREAGFIGGELFRSVALSRMGRLQLKYPDIQIIPWLGSGSAVMRSGPGAPYGEFPDTLKFLSFSADGSFASLWGGLPRTIQPEALEQACLALRAIGGSPYPRYDHQYPERKLHDLDIAAAATNLESWISRQPRCTSAERRHALTKMLEAFRPMMEQAALPPVLQPADDENGDGNVDDNRAGSYSDEIYDDELSRIALGGLFAREHAYRTAMYIVPLLRISSLLWPHNQVGRLKATANAFSEKDGEVWLEELKPIYAGDAVVDSAGDTEIQGATYSRPILDISGVSDALRDVLTESHTDLLQSVSDDLQRFKSLLEATMPRGVSGERAITETFSRFLLPSALTTVHTLGIAHEHMMEGDLFKLLGYRSSGDFLIRGFPSSVLDMMAASIRADGIAQMADTSDLTRLLNPLFIQPEDKIQLQRILQLQHGIAPPSATDPVNESTGLLFRHQNDIERTSQLLQYGSSGRGQSAVPDLNDKAVYKYLLLRLYDDPVFQRRLNGDRISLREWATLMKDKVIPILAIPSWRRIG